MSNYTRYKARPTIYKGIRMRSRLEASYAEFLDTFGWSWQYEPLAFASEDGQYLPDFLTWIEPGLVKRNEPSDEAIDFTYVEVKPAVFVTDDVLRRMHIIRASDPTARLKIEFSPGEHTPWDYIECAISQGCNICRHDAQPRTTYDDLSSLAYRFVSRHPACTNLKLELEMVAAGYKLFAARKAIRELIDAGFIKSDNGRLFVPQNEAPF